MSVVSLSIRKNDKFIVLEQAIYEDKEGINPFQFFLRKGNSIDEHIASCFIDADKLYDVLDRELEDGCVS